MQTLTLSPLSLQVAALTMLHSPKECSQFPLASDSAVSSLASPLSSLPVSVGTKEFSSSEAFSQEQSSKVTSSKTIKTISLFFIIFSSWSIIIGNVAFYSAHIMIISPNSDAP